ncbi:sulfurtransferase [Bacillaceae bacterium IKA-2]|nr:sulfurtransferase [Bacillaceae bacterium IKA-2]
MYMILIALLIVSLLYVYQRHFPVLHVPSMDDTDNNISSNTVLLDVRDYQDASHKPVQGAVNLPYAYLKRHHRQITSSQVVVVASDAVSKNLTIRFLKGHGFKVIGYQLIK